MLIIIVWINCCVMASPPYLQVREGAVQALVNLCSGSTVTRRALMQQGGAAALLEAATRNMNCLPASSHEACGDGGETADAAVHSADAISTLALSGLMALSADTALAAPLVLQLGAAAPLLQLLLSAGRPLRVQVGMGCAQGCGSEAGGAQRGYEECRMGSQALVRQGALY